MAGELLQAADKAFDYRGDVTIDFNDGTSVAGYLYNREIKASEPFVEIYLENEPVGKKFFLKDIKDIRLTGDDMAAGKSWEEWMARREREKQKGIERSKRGSDTAHEGDQHRDLKVF